MSNYITEIKVNKIFHLQDFTIPVCNSERKHLIITGKNGSGKTLLLNAIIDYLDMVVRHRMLSIDKKNLRLKEDSLSIAKEKNDVLAIEANLRDIERYKADLQRFVTRVEVLLGDEYPLMQEVGDRKFIIAYYADNRKPAFVEPRNPVKPDLNIAEVKQSKVDQFLNFMVDCKIQEALARNEGKTQDADYIRSWFDGFQQILRKLFEDEELELNFNYKDYSFHIHNKGKVFKFTELSAGYSAALDIVTDLILKMQEQNQVIRAYQKEGIVLIDEVETHLHLELQRLILPILTSIFPNIQFIITTHSPFILNSLPNVVAFDLEHREPISDLTDYSYEALAEGYFGVKTESSEIEMRLKHMEELINAASLTVSEQKELEEYLSDFDKMPEAVAPNVKARYYELNRLWNAKKLGEK